MKRSAETGSVKSTSTKSKIKKAKTKGIWNLRLYVAGQTSRSLVAFANLKQICEENLGGNYHIEVIDLLKNPQLARGDQILAIPTLVRKLPPPIKRIIGDLSNKERVIVGLDMRPAQLPNLDHGGMKSAC